MTGTRDALVEVAHALANLSESELLEQLRLLGRARRLIDAIGVEVSGRVAELCPADATSLARKNGERSAADLVAHTAGVDSATASTWLTVGVATAPRRSLLGELLPAEHEPVGAALEGGGLSAPVAREIIATVEACRLDLGEARDFETMLTVHAAQMDRRLFSRFCRQLVAQYIPEDAVEREKVLRARESLRVTQLPDGMLHIVADAYGENAGFILAALDAETAPKRVRFRDPNAVEDDTRSLARRRLDALARIARQSLAHDDGKVAGRSVTMVVTMGLDSLLSGIGSATIEGLDQPISASAARRLAAEAHIIPAVLGSRSEPLDLGQRVRIFSEAQRQAIALRDGGCAFPDCTAPPGWCEIAHILAAVLDGPADLLNGIMLCVRHHHLFDEDGWSVEWRDGVPWFIPPAHVDATRTPRPGGRVAA